MKGRKFSAFCLKCTLCVLGLILLTTGCVLVKYKCFQKLFHSQIEKDVALMENSEASESWASPGSAEFFQVWLLHVENPSQVVQTGAKPVLLQKGPYTYRLKREKVDVVYESNQQIISYREKKWYHFDQELSVGAQNDTFTTVNLPMLTIANLVRFQSAWVRKMIEQMMTMMGEHLFISLSARDLLWGYQDRMLKAIKDRLAALGIKVPIDDTFGLFYKSNGSTDGVYRIRSGSGDTIHRLADIVSWNGNTSLKYWNSVIANMLNGSDGTLYPPFVDKGKPLYLFSPEFCRSLEIQYTEGYALKGIDLDRFVLPPIAFANVSINPNNIGFCTPYTNCLPAGLLNASVCRDGIPVIVSLPHFLDGDPGLGQRVMGLRPNRLQHQSLFDVEPVTGRVMHSAKRLQINTYLTNTTVSETGKLHDYVVMPILWLNKSSTIDDGSASTFRQERDVMVTVLDVAVVGSYGLIVLGLLLLMGGIGGLWVDVLGPSSTKGTTGSFGDKPVIASIDYTPFGDKPVIASIDYTPFGDKPVIASIDYTPFGDKAPVISKVA